jgi:EAL domain-containing protein (putative c-di-GMP-specific phosphodiesterase class I)
MGMVVCLDDFGTGYASLAWLHRFPVDEIKIDKSFVAEICTDRRSQILVGAALNLAHSLGLPVVAEGVETAEQARELRAANCEYAQGYHFGRPLEAADAERLL